LVGAILLARSIASLLYGITPFDTATFAIVSLVLAIVALLASYIPARRAASVDPLVALRYE
jgi:putative ABC transport system permease protein